MVRNLSSVVVDNFYLDNGGWGILDSHLQICQQLTQLYKINKGLALLADVERCICPDRKQLVKIGDFR